MTNITTNQFIAAITAEINNGAANIIEACRSAFGTVPTPHAGTVCEIVETHGVSPTAEQVAEVASRRAAPEDDLRPII